MYLGIYRKFSKLYIAIFSLNKSEFFHCTDLKLKVQYFKFVYKTNYGEHVSGLLYVVQQVYNLYVVVASFIRKYKNKWILAVGYKQENSTRYNYKNVVLLYRLTRLWSVRMDCVVMQELVSIVAQYPISTKIDGGK